MFLKFIFNQKEKCGFISPKTFDFIQKKSCPLKIDIPEFQKYKKKLLSILERSLKKKHKHELFHRYFSRKEITTSGYLNVKIPHSQLFQEEYLFTGKSAYLQVNKYWGVVISQ